MGSYGRNFEFRVPPVHGERGGRYVHAGSTAIPIGAPVKYTGDGGDAALSGAMPVELATGAQAPERGTCGIVVFEHLNVYGDDPVLTTYSDRDTVPVGKMCQVISGDRVKVLLRNTEDRTFMTVRDYEGRVMVAGLGATPTVTVGDMLTPGTGDDSAGYWAETSTASEAWLIVEQVDSARGEVECRVNF